ncbi:MAG: hypothetical protein IKM00_01935, partial [Clostridia bacterium]|nr:hypothetical protein [Clostridia bacterium]
SCSIMITVILPFLYKIYVVCTESGIFICGQAIYFFDFCSKMPELLTNCKQKDTHGGWAGLHSSLYIEKVTAEEW